MKTPGLQSYYFFQMAPLEAVGTGVLDLGTGGPQGFYEFRHAANANSFFPSPTMLHFPEI